MALNVTTGDLNVLRKEAYGGLPGETTLDCADGILIVAVIDFYAQSSPTLLLAFDFVESDAAFRNNTILDIHELWLADPKNVRK